MPMCLPDGCYSRAWFDWLIAAGLGNSCAAACPIEAMFSRTPSKVVIIPHVARQLRPSSCLPHPAITRNPQPIICMQTLANVGKMHRNIKSNIKDLKRDLATTSPLWASVRPPDNASKP